MILDYTQYGPKRANADGYGISSINSTLIYFRSIIDNRLLKQHDAHEMALLQPQPIGKLTCDVRMAIHPSITEAAENIKSQCRIFAVTDDGRRG